MKPLAIVTGITGQDGFFLTGELLENGYTVVGTTHRSDGPATWSAHGATMQLERLNACDFSAMIDLLRRHQPRIVFNLAARASSAQLFDDPVASAHVNGLSVMHWLESIRKADPEVRFIQASSCEVFSGTLESPQRETTAYAPRSAYGAAKAFGDHCVAAYRSTHGLHCASAILYPHESSRRSDHFLVKKVVRAAAEFSRGRTEPLRLGDLETVRDWGYAGDHMRALFAMSRAELASDYVIATGVGHSVRDVCEFAFGAVRLDYRDHVVTDPSLMRGIDPFPKIGDATRASAQLGWRARMKFRDVVESMLSDELKRADVKNGIG